jgi:hypothetical protein
MEAKKLFRSSGCLVIAGAVLLVASLSALGLGVLLVLVGPGATRQTASRHDTEAKTKAVVALQKIPDLPDALIRELESTGRVSEETLSLLPLEQRQRARTVLLDYYGQRVSGGVATGLTAGVGVVFVLVLLAFGTPGTIVGLVLLRRRKVWCCAGCGFAFERT